MSDSPGVLRVRWLGRVPYEEAYLLQKALHGGASDDYLLLLEHPHVFTLGVRADPAHVLVDPVSVGAGLVRTDRGGDVTYHGPGQLVAYPIVRVPSRHRSIPCHVHAIEQVVIDTLADFGLDAGRMAGFSGVWIDPDGPLPRKICAIGVKVAKGRSMHGAALNVSTDLSWFERIVPCGIKSLGVTSLQAEGVDASITEVKEVFAKRAAKQWAPHGRIDRQDVTGFLNAQAERDGSVPFGAGDRLRVRLSRAGGSPDDGLELRARKPQWLRVPARMGSEYLSLKRTVRDLGLVTVCEEAGCPNIFECWAEGTATFMINGERCTRKCGFCLVDTRKPLALDPQEPEQVARAVERLGLAHAVITAVARDDLEDGGASAFVATVRAIRNRCSSTSVELLIPDCKGDGTALDAIFESRPDVLNHNLETVARLHYAVRPSAGYARSLAVLARAKQWGLLTKSGMILGMGETRSEVLAALADLRAVGVDIVTLGQYLRPSSWHLPVSRWLEPSEFEDLERAALEMGFSYVQASPLTRSSYHARAASEHARPSAPANA